MCVDGCVSDLVLAECFVGNGLTGDVYITKENKGNHFVTELSQRGGGLEMNRSLQKIK